MPRPGSREPAQTPKSGEPNDYQTLYRFRCSQEEGILRAMPMVLREWAGKRQEPWHGAMEATLLSGWVYDALKPFARALEIGNPSMMKAISAAKKKTTSWMRGKSQTWLRCRLQSGAAAI